MSDITTGPGMHELVLHLARHRRGLAWLHLYDLEAAAVTLGIDARTVVLARDALETPEGRAEFIAAVRQARAELAGQDAVTDGGAGPPQPVPLRSGRELIRAAAEHPYGLEFLRQGFLESVAVVFQVHPRLVLRARSLLQRWEARRGSPSDR